MKIIGNWPFWIVVTLSLIVIFIITNIIIFSSQKWDMVESNYYEKELKYQSHIDKVNRANCLKDTLKITQNDNLLTFSFPRDFIGKKINGRINFYRPSGSEMDFHIPIQLTDSLKQYYIFNKQKGFWIIKIDWAVGDSSYYFEEEARF
jgi:hypothetical protein